jgi:hypothetical protein
MNMGYSWVELLTVCVVNFIAGYISGKYLD